MSNSTNWNCCRAKAATEAPAGDRSNNKNAQGEGAPSLSQITPAGGIGGLEHHHYYHLQDGDPSPHRNRQNSIDLKNEFEKSFTRPFPSCAQKIRA